MAGWSGRTRTTRPTWGSSTASPTGSGSAGGGGDDDGGNGRVRTADRSEPEGRLELADAVEVLPREAAVGCRPAEVTVGGGALVDRPAQVEVAQDGGGSQVEDL